jgi:hypothetical protein
MTQQKYRNAYFGTTDKPSFIVVLSGRTPEGFSGSKRFKMQVHSRGRTGLPQDESIGKCLSSKSTGGATCTISRHSWHVQSLTKAHVLGCQSENIGSSAGAKCRSASNMLIKCWCHVLHQKLQSPFRGLLTD